MSKPKSFGLGSLFHQTTEQIQQRLKDKFNPKANYPNYDGAIDIPAASVPELVDYLLGATPNEDGVIKLQLSGWKRTAKTSGKTYLSLQLSEDRRFATSAAPQPDSEVF